MGHLPPPPLPPPPPPPTPQCSPGACLGALGRYAHAVSAPPRLAGNEVDRDLLQQLRVIALEMQPFLKLDE